MIILMVLANHKEAAPYVEKPLADTLGSLEECAEMDELGGHCARHRHLVHDCSTTMADGVSDVERDASWTGRVKPTALQVRFGNPRCWEVMEHRSLQEARTEPAERSEVPPCDECQHSLASISGRSMNE